MSVKRPVDIIDWKGERARKIIRSWGKLKYEIILKGDREYVLRPYEIIRLVNIIVTANRFNRSLGNFEKLVWKGRNNWDINRIYKSMKMEECNESEQKVRKRIKIKLPSIII